MCLIVIIPLVLHTVSDNIEGIELTFLERMNEEQEWLLLFFIFATLALATPGTKWCSIDALCSHVALPRRPEGPRVGHSSSNNQSRLKCSFVVTMCLN